MAALVFDSGALIAIERGDRRVGAILLHAARGGIDVVTSSGCIAETWRDPARQARLARALQGIVEHPLEPDAARRAGILLAQTGGSNVVDAAVAQLARHGDVVLTSDPTDIDALIDATGVAATTRRV